ncbi:LuxR C-terminal-related transcriptional regulator [Streptomyces xiangluensis]|uniref:LuxR C-terminal-related transcriptional regulator n=1 Tax=Streptomyces xiangluensis TaxID=2665720 RepID=A0ABV8YRY7_9ACTN
MAIPENSLILTRELQAALTVEEVGRAYLQAVRDVIFARGRGLYRLDDRTQTFVGQAADVPAALIDQYAAVGGGDDPVLDAAVATRRPVASSERTVVSTWTASRAHEVLRNFGFTYSLKAPLVVGTRLWGSIHFTRGPGDPPFTAQDRLAAGLVVDQLGIALGRALRYEETMRRVILLEAALDCVAQPVIVTDYQGRLVHRNRATERPGATGGAAIGDIVAHTISQAAAVFEEENRRVVVSHVERGTPEPTWVRSTRLPAQSAVVSLVYATTSGPGQALPTLGILSRRQQEIAQLVSEGLSTRDIATRAFITENTVKQHLKRMFAKLGVRNRAELVQLIWSATSEASPDSAVPQQG